MLDFTIGKYWVMLVYDNACWDETIPLFQIDCFFLSKHRRHLIKTNIIQSYIGITSKRLTLTIEWK